LSFWYRRWYFSLDSPGSSFGASLGEPILANSGMPSCIGKRAWHDWQTAASSVHRTVPRQVGQASRGSIKARF
jgi:hypothetical protein